MTVTAELQELIARCGTADGPERRQALEDLAFVAADESVATGSVGAALLAAVTSRMISAFEVDSDVPEELRALWRRYDPDRQRPGTFSQILAAGKLLYDRNDYERAVPFFRRYLESHADDFRSSLLLVYSLEAWGRIERMPEPLNEAVRVAESLLPREANHERAEVHHALGHAFIGLFLVSPDPQPGFRRTGIDHLRQAAELNAGYTSCYTSAFAEMEDYVRTINVSFEMLENRQRFRELPANSGETVEMEVVFYIAYAYLCIGEYDAALRCWRHFAARMRDAGRREAEDHARLFMIKTMLKRSLIDDLMPDELIALSEELKGLAFPSRSAQPVAEEARRYEAVVSVLLSAARHRRDDSRDSWRHLVGDSMALLSKLDPTFFSPGSQPLLLVHDGVGEKSFSQDHLMPLLSWANSVTVDELQEASRQHDLLGVLTSEPLPTQALLTADEGFAFVAMLKDKSKEEYRYKSDSPVFYGDSSEVVSALYVMTALSLCRKFLIRNRYIFGLAPCVDSPALEYQRAVHTITPDLV
jgi:tetratricopeptide (TPR) repeat protein